MHQLALACSLSASPQSLRPQTKALTLCSECRVHAHTLTHAHAHTHTHTHTECNSLWACVISFRQSVNQCENNQEEPDFLFRLTDRESEKERDRVGERRMKETENDEGEMEETEREREREREIERESKVR